LANESRYAEAEQWPSWAATKTCLADEILRFMQASRVAYNSFVLYHNFRHAIDVLQSLFYFLLQIGTIPPYPTGSTPPPHSQDKSPIAQLLRPFEALTLLISAIGHDVGHPGVNNMFLVKLNAPLAQLYNDQSVLEAFHCAAYSQILRRHWPSVFADRSLRKLLISSILATDMGVHPDYIQRLGNLQEKIHETKTTDGWAPKDVEACRILICGLLIKCADISNVVRAIPDWVCQRALIDLGETMDGCGTVDISSATRVCVTR
jgi:3',5'-cyclic-nucleotide phosphodiesterase